MVGLKPAIDFYGIRDLHTTEIVYNGYAAGQPL